MIWVHFFTSYFICFLFSFFLFFFFGLILSFKFILFYVYIHMYVHTYPYICICIYTYIQATQTVRTTDRRSKRPHLNAFMLNKHLLSWLIELSSSRRCMYSYILHSLAHLWCVCLYSLACNIVLVYMYVYTYVLIHILMNVFL